MKAACKSERLRKSANLIRQLSRAKITVLVCAIRITETAIKTGGSEDAICHTVCTAFGIPP